ncbi:hypothetical protein HQ529_04815 [Candidatus Woesearchaeota archaeon]|nr:hypothetical protein [Candidatus Woesearchaeota archaeon]
MKLFTKKSISVKEHERIKKYFYDELRKKDLIIDELNKKNELLLSSMVKQASKNHELEVKLKR